MAHMLSITAALMLSAQVASEPAPVPEPFPMITDLSLLPIEEATGPRCAIAFAVIQGLQVVGDAKAKTWPDMLGGNAREFFVVQMAKLMDARKLQQADISRIVQSEVSRLSALDYKAAHEMMPACLLLLPEARK